MLGQTLGHYDILGRLGVGGMAEVYRARDRRLGREVALKILPADMAGNPGLIRRFEREARLIAALNHPNIITIYSVDESEGVHFFTMELADGLSLDQQIPERGFTPSRFFEIALPLVDALAAAHRRGIIHRDLKPANIVITTDGDVKVLDFGLARLDQPVHFGREEDSGVDLTAAEEIISGTVPYMAPEQLEGNPVDHRSDIFSLGIVLFEMATGRRPFAGRTTAELILSILKDPPPSGAGERPDFPPRLWRLIQECLARDPAERPVSTQALGEELAAVDRSRKATREAAAPSIAVLPFVDMSEEHDQEHLCDGLAEELTARLGRIRHLRVASRTSSFMYKKAAVPVAEIGRQLHVDTVLEGSVRKANERLRVTVQLIGVADGYEIWSERFDREMKDVFAIQDEMARSVVDALAVTLDPEEGRLLAAAGTESVQAYDYYLRGRKFYFQYGRKGIEMARQMFSLAIRHDPAYAQAHAGIADCCFYLFLYADRSKASLEEADKASLKALELNPGLAEVHASRGLVLSLMQQHDASESEFETALRLGPRLFEAHYFYARDCFAQGKLEKAARLFEDAAEVSPDDYQAPLLTAQIYESLNRPEEAAAVRRRGVRIVEERLKSNPDDVRALYMGANGLINLGDRDKALEWAALAREMEPDEPMVLYNLGCIYSRAGEIGLALECVERAVKAGLAQKGWYDHDPDLNALRGEPRFKALQPYLV